MSDNRTSKTIIYGPVQSRRFGKSLGINISGPGKYCSFNCIYCFRGFNEGSPDSQSACFPDLQQVINELDEYIENNDLNLLDDITIAGNGEPTDNRYLPEIIDYLNDLKIKKFHRLKISILTNGMGFIPTVNPNFDTLLSSVNKVDRLCVKLDSGNPKTWNRIANPGNKVGFDVWLEAIRKIKSPFIQTMLINGRIDNTTDEELEKLMDCYKILNPCLVYLITLNKLSADSRIMPVPADKMQRIKKAIAEKVPSSILTQ